MWWSQMRCDRCAVTDGGFVHLWVADVVTDVVTDVVVTDVVTHDKWCRGAPCP